MMISVCIPHYNRSKYLLAVLESIRIQDHPEVEVIISDDCSTDDSSEIIPKYIAGLEGASHVRFYYIRQAKNLGYDGNLRASLAAATGDYLFALGNDDALPEKNTLSKLADTLAKLNYPDITFSNYHTYNKPDEMSQRARKTEIIGSGPDVAVKTFRSFSFVGGLAIKRSAFKEHDTCKYDGTVYVQIYLGARIIASGGTLATISESMVAKDVTFPGEAVNSYLDTLVENNRRFYRHTGGLDQVGRVASEAILPYVPVASRQRYILNIYAQLLLFTYPYWLFNYRKHNAYRAAINVALGCVPTNLIKIADVALYVYFCLIIVFVATTIAGLFVPVKMLARMTGVMSRLSKTVRPRNRGAPGAKPGLPTN
jgi:glycosyltransferase involved in cell wall biosynthesis